MRGLNLKTMSVDDLLILRDQVCETLSSRVETERRDLESRLARLRKVDLTDSKQTSAGGRSAGGKRGKVTPKYRNPENTSETWAGRGLQPRWLSAAIKAGKKLSDFEITAAAQTVPRARRRRRPKAK